MSSIFDTIKQRRAVYPKSYLDKQIPKELIQQILEMANWAPTHKRTEPWRFRVFQTQSSRNELSVNVAEAMEAMAKPGKFNPEKQARMRRKIQKAGCVIAIVLQRDLRESLPEWEEIAAVACAVQNMWLACTELGIGAYWSSPSFLTNHNHDFLFLESGQRCLGLFYMGWKDQQAPVVAQRGDIADKVRWIS